MIITLKSYFTQKVPRYSWKSRARKSRCEKIEDMLGLEYFEEVSTVQIKGELSEGKEIKGINQRQEKKKKTEKTGT